MIIITERKRKEKKKKKADQIYDVLILSKVLTQSSKLLLFFSLHIKRHEGTIDYSSRHDPRQPKSTEENIPNSTSNFTMKQKMVYRLFIPFT
jgi:hypothetical protein